MVKDRDGTELQVGDWVKRVSPGASWIKVGDVVQITSVFDYSVYVNKMGPYFPEFFVKVERHPQADTIIAAANDMNIEVRGYKGKDVFKCVSFYVDEPYLAVDHTLNPPETPEQKTLREAKEALAEAQALVNATTEYLIKPQEKTDLELLKQQVAALNAKIQALEYNNGYR